MAPFLAMAELKRALFCSSGLTKTLDFILRFSSFVFRFIPTSLVSPFQFPCSSHFVPSLPAWFWDLMRIHWWLTEELPTSVCGRNVQCDEWFSLGLRCKDSANRVKCKRETRFSFHSRGAAYLGLQCKGTKKNNRFTHLSHDSWPIFQRLVTFLCVSMRYKGKIWSINLGDYCILLNIRQIGGALYVYWLEPVVKSWVCC